MDLELEEWQLPVTSLLFLELSRVYLLVGEGPWLKIFQYHDSKEIHCGRIFANQTVHGFKCCKRIFDHGDEIGVIFVWGGSSFAIIHFQEASLQGEAAAHVTTKISERIADDWILDAIFLQGDPLHLQEISGAPGVIIITAHNELYALSLVCCTESGSQPRLISSGSACILYSAHLAWIDEQQLLVAAGTVTGEIIVWKANCGNQKHGMAPSHVVYNLNGHDGSIFGVRISSVIKSGTFKGGRLLASCSDDRTIKLWNISHVDDHETSDLPAQCLASAMGHASRIWSLHFLEPLSHHSCLYSIGEDCTGQLWKLQSSSSSSDGKADTLSLDHCHTHAFHTGKNIWASDVLLRQDGSYLVVTGSASGRIVTYVIDTFSLPFVDDVPYIDQQQFHDKDQVATRARSGVGASRTLTFTEKVFRSMIGHWILHRDVRSVLKSQPSGTLQGIAKFELRDPADAKFDIEATYEEEGRFSADSGFQLNASRRYVYRYESITDQISVWFIKPDTCSVDYLFHEITFDIPTDLTTNGLIKSAISGHGFHLCEQDQYSPRYHMIMEDDQISEWTLQYTVKGPHKDYISTATMTRSDLHRVGQHLNMLSDTISPPTQPVNEQDFGLFKAYAWLNTTTLLATADSGKIILGRVEQGTKSHPSQAQYRYKIAAWDLLEECADLRGTSMTTVCKTAGLAFFTGRTGSIYCWNFESRKVIMLKSGTRKIGYFNAKTTSSHSSQSECTMLLVRRLGTMGSELYSVCPFSVPTISTIIDSSTPDSQKISSEFVTTSWCYHHGRAGSLLVEGSRFGQLCITIIPLSESNERQISPGLHDGNAITEICCMPTDGEFCTFLTTGRDGKYAVHRFDLMRFDLETIHVVTLPFGPNIEGIMIQPSTRHMMFWGFSSTDFVVWNETLKQETMRIGCGGAHRNWAYIQEENSGGGALVWTKASACKIYAQTKSSHSVLQLGGHGREMKTLAISSLMTVTSFSDCKAPKPPSRIRLIATGAEDTAIRISCLETSLIQATPEIMTNHTAGLQQLKWSPDGAWLFSAAGCEELFAWRVQIGSAGLAVCLKAQCPNVTPDKALRVMDIDIVPSQGTADDGDSQPLYTIYAAYSNSDIYIWQLSHASGCDYSISQIGKTSYGTRCLTGSHYLPCRDGILTTSSDGHIALCKMGQEDCDLNSNSRFLRFPAHQGSIKDLAVSLCNIIPSDGESVLQPQAKQCKDIILTAGDDQSIALTLLPTQYDTCYVQLTPQSSTLLISRAHAAAVTGIAFLGHGTAQKLHFATISNDQGLKIWRILIDPSQSGIAAFDVNVIASRDSAVADASAMDVYEDEDGSWRLVIVGIGIEYWRVPLSLC